MNTYFPHLAATIAFGTILGVCTNAFNGWFSPIYFVNILHWTPENVWLKSIAQGAMEGTISGILIASLLGLTIRFWTTEPIPFDFVRTKLQHLSFVLVATWLVGACVAMSLASAAPDLYRTVIISVPNDFNEMIRYAWVGGSIIGLMLGAVPCAIWLVIKVHLYRSN